ncbi:hypothetical protein [Bradyrhizobium sp. UFLA05-112]
MRFVQIARHPKRDDSNAQKWLGVSIGSALNQLVVNARKKSRGSCVTGSIMMLDGGCRTL